MWEISGKEKYHLQNMSALERAQRKIETAPSAVRP